MCLCDHVSLPYLLSMSLVLLPLMLNSPEGPARVEHDASRICRADFLACRRYFSEAHLLDATMGGEKQQSLTGYEDLLLSPPESFHQAERSSAPHQHGLAAPGSLLTENSAGSWKRSHSAK